MKNIDLQTIEGFGSEWSSFDQNGLNDDDKLKIFNDYFYISPLPRGIRLLDSYEMMSKPWPFAYYRDK